MAAVVEAVAAAIAEAVVAAMAAAIAEAVAAATVAAAAVAAAASAVAQALVATVASSVTLGSTHMQLGQQCYPIAKLGAFAKWACGKASWEMA